MSSAAALNAAVESYRALLDQVGARTNTAATSWDIGVPFEELGAAGVLPVGDARRLGHQHERGGPLSVWELCELARRPDFRTSGDVSRGGRFKRQFVRELGQGTEAKEAAAVADADADSVSSEGADSASSGGEGRARHEPGSPEARHEALRGSLENIARPTAWADAGSETRVLPTTVSGTWEPGVVAGMGSIHNPQIQIHTCRLTWLQADLHVDAAAGGLEIKVLRRSRWGIRRTDRALQDSKVPGASPFVGGPGQRRAPPRDLVTEVRNAGGKLRCECELPPGGIFTLVLAREQPTPTCGDGAGAGDALSGDGFGRATTDGGSWVERWRASTQLARVFEGPWAPKNPEAAAEERDERTVFTLRVWTSCPLARGPLLLRQRTTGPRGGRHLLPGDDLEIVEEVPRLSTALPSQFGRRHVRVGSQLSGDLSGLGLSPRGPVAAEELPGLSSMPRNSHSRPSPQTESVSEKRWLGSCFALSGEVLSLMRHKDRKPKRDDAVRGQLEDDWAQADQHKIEQLCQEFVVVTGHNPSAGGPPRQEDLEDLAATGGGFAGYYLDGLAGDGAEQEGSQHQVGKRMDEVSHDICFAARLTLNSDIRHLYRGQPPPSAGHRRGREASEGGAVALGLPSPRPGARPTPPPPPRGRDSRSGRLQARSSRKGRGGAAA